jgi:hypothetical protein
VAGAGNFSLHHCVQTGSGALSLGIKQQHVNLRSRMHGAIPPLPKYAFMAWCSVEAQGQLCFALLWLCCAFHFPHL